MGVDIELSDIPKQDTCKFRAMPSSHAHELSGTLTARETQFPTGVNPRPTFQNSLGQILLLRTNGKARYRYPFIHGFYATICSTTLSPGENVQLYHQHVIPRYLTEPRAIAYLVIGETVHAKLRIIFAHREN